MHGPRNKKKPRKMYLERGWGCGNCAKCTGEKGQRILNRDSLFLARA
jgi:hypothetical protein